MTAIVGGILQVFIPTHLLAIIVLGLLCGQGAKRFPGAALTACAFGVTVGSFVIAAGVREQNAVPFLLAIAGLSGLVVAVAWTIPSLAKQISASATGGVLALNSPPQEITISAAVTSQIGTVLAALTTLAIVTWIATQAERPWQRIGIRIVGSWIAASAIFVLALRLPR